MNPDAMYFPLEHLSEEERNKVYTERFHKLMRLIKLDNLLKEATRTLLSEKIKKGGS